MWHKIGSNFYSTIIDFPSSWRYIFLASLHGTVPVFLVHRFNKVSPLVHTYIIYRGEGTLRYGTIHMCDQYIFKHTLNMFLSIYQIVPYTCFSQAFRGGEAHSKQVLDKKQVREGFKIYPFSQKWLFLDLKKCHVPHCEKSTLSEILCICVQYHTWMAPR